MNRPVRRADRLVLAVLLALVAVLGTQTGAVGVPPPDAANHPDSVPVDPAGDGQHDSEAEQPPAARPERRHARACERPQAGSAGDAVPRSRRGRAAVPVAPPPQPSPRSVVLRC